MHVIRYGRTNEKRSKCLSKTIKSELRGLLYNKSESDGALHKALSFRTRIYGSVDVAMQSTLIMAHDVATQ